MGLKVENLSVVYPNGMHAIDDVNFELPKGVICGLVGVSGAGKSTIFKSIMGFVKQAQGQIQIFGKSVHEAIKENLVAYVPQTEDVDWNFPVLVEDVVMMGRYGHMGFFKRARAGDLQAVEESLRKVNMWEFRKRQIGELSGGQKKRVFVARALAQKGQILLLDEPFTGVDIKTEDALTDLFKELAREGALILVSTHNLGSVPSFCQQVVLINRSVLAYGPVESTFTQDNLMKAFGAKLRHVNLEGSILHDDEDERAVTVLADDESPLVFYGATEKEIVARKKAEKEDKDR